jgi:hypothetical protein
MYKLIKKLKRNREAIASEQKKENGTLTDIEKERLNMIMVEYQKINSGIDERVKMVDSLTNLSLLITAGYLTALSVINPGIGDSFSYETNAIVALGVILMQYFIILQILRSDYLMLNLVEYYYTKIRYKVEDILETNDTYIWGYEHYKYQTINENKFDRFQFNILSLMRYGIPFASCILIGIHFYFNNADSIVEPINAWFTLLIVIFVALLTVTLFGIMLRWAWFSTTHTKSLVSDREMLSEGKSKSKGKILFATIYIFLVVIILFLVIAFARFLRG